MNFAQKSMHGVAGLYPDDDLILYKDEAIERMGDQDIYREIAHYFASRLEQSLQDLGLALGRADTEEATRLAHSMKSNCATVGAEAMRVQCFTLEKLCRAGNIEAAREHYALLAPKMLAMREKLLAV